MITYCGLYCGACPSYQKGTCLGCRSENRAQNRKSKWGCKIRECCKKKEIEHCGQCSNFPCTIINKRLIKSHRENPKFNYRHQIPNNINRILEVGMIDWSKEQELLWKCPECGSPLRFYSYDCSKCAYQFDPQTIKEQI